MTIALIQYEINRLIGEESRLVLQRSVLLDQVNQLNELSSMYANMKSNMSNNPGATQAIDAYIVMLNTAQTRILQMLSTIDTQYRTIAPQRQALQQMGKQSIQQTFSTFGS